MSLNAAKSTSPGRKAELVLGDMEPTSAFEFESADGTALYGEWFASPNPRALALIVHGYAEHCARYRELAHVLVTLGLSVLSYDMRGHGRAQGQRGHVDSYLDYLTDLQAALDALDRRADNRSLPILIIGHSNGGLITLRHLADPLRRSSRIQAAVISSPFLALKMKVPAAKRLAARLASRVHPNLAIPNGLRIEDLTHDPDKLAQRDGDTLCHETASARWVTAAFDAQNYVAQMAHRIRVPTLWLVAGDDPICDPAMSRQVQRKLRTRSRLVDLPGMFHEVFNETDRGTVFELLKGFVDERFSV